MQLSHPHSVAEVVLFCSDKNKGKFNLSVTFSAGFTRIVETDYDCVKEIRQLRAISKDRGSKNYA